MRPTVASRPRPLHYLRGNRGRARTRATLPAMTTTTITTVVDDYLAAWNARDADERRALVERAFAPDATYVDAHRSGAGHAALDAMIATAQQEMPGHSVQPIADVDTHHDRVRFSWTLVGPDGPVAIGRDFAILGADGRLSDVTGFVDPVGA
jgi:hypothetical protein